MPTRLAFPVMSNRTQQSLRTACACHAVIGAGLGTFLALATIVGNVELFNRIVSSPSPQLAVLIVVGAAASMIAAGSALTGYIFCAVERS